MPPTLIKSSSIIFIEKFKFMIKFGLFYEDTTKGQNEFMRSSLLPKCQPKILRISALEIYYFKINTKRESMFFLQEYTLFCTNLNLTDLKNWSCIQPNIWHIFKEFGSNISPLKQWNYFWSNHIFYFYTLIRLTIS